MLLSLRSILQGFPSVKVIRYLGEESVRDYRDIVWMGVFSGNFQENCIYIGNLSQFPSEIPQKGIALIIRNDTGTDDILPGIEIAEVAMETEMAELCLMIHNKLFLGHEIPEITNVLLSGLFSNCGINEIIDTAFVHLNNPIMVMFSKNHKNLYYSCGEDLQYEFNVPESIIRQRESAIGYTQMRKSVQLELQRCQPILIEDGDYFKGKRRALSAITQGTSSREQLGVMALFEVNQPITERDLALVSIISQMLSEKCASPAFRENLIHSSYEQRLQALIVGKWMEADMEWITELFGEKPYDFSLAMVDVRTMNAYRTEALQYVFSRTIRADITLTRGSYFIAITNLSGRDAAHYVHQLRELAKNDHIVIGCSDRFNDILKLKKHYGQSKMLIHYAQHFGLANQLCEFSHLKANVLIHEIADKIDLDYFVSDDLERLLEIDEEKNCEYYRTLTAWMHSGLNRETVREQLHIHRNTLAYRLERIEEILGVKLNEENTLLNLYLSEIIRSQRLLDLNDTRSDINKL